MTIDELTLAGCAILILLAIVTPLINPFFRKSFINAENKDDDEKIDAALPKITILLAPHDNARELEQHLPLMLAQDYPDFQVVVVAEKGDSETEDVLKRFASDRHLYYTYIPESSRYMSRKKLAISLGVKAAKSEWILLTEPTCAPVSDQWLCKMSAHCNDDKNLVIGYSNYNKDTSAYKRFEQLRTSFYLFRKAWGKKAYRCNTRNLMFRKSEFLKADGFLGNLELVRGEYDFIVNKFARENSTAIELSTEARLVENEPSDKTWTNSHLYDIASHKLLKRGFTTRLLTFTDQLTLHLNYLAILAALIFAAITHRWVLAAAAVLSLLITLFMRASIVRKAIRPFEEGISGIKALCYEVTHVWRNLGYRYKYWRADKNDFTSHKL